MRLLNSIKVAFFFALKVQGGAETLMLEVFRHSDDYGLKALGIYRHSGIMEAAFRDTGVPLYRIPFKTHKIGDLICLRKYIKDNHIDIVHAQQPIDACYAIMATIGLPTKVVFTVHGYDMGSVSTLLRFALRYSDANVFVSCTQQDYYEKKYRLNPDRQHLIYNGVNFDRIDKAEVGDIRNELSIARDLPLIGSIGNFLPGRNPMMVCMMLKNLADRGCRFHAIFVGKKVDGHEALYDDCVNFCNDNGLRDKVSFLGYRRDIASLLRQMDVFAYYSDHDTFGIAVVEAMSAGVPVLVNDWEVMREISEEGRFATLYKSNDEGDFSDKMFSLLTSLDEAKMHSVELKTVVRERYSIERHMTQLRVLYCELLGRT